jgi:hypothetical protein
MDVLSLLGTSMYKRGHIADRASLPRWKMSSWMSGSLKMGEDDINSLRDCLVDLNFSRKVVNEAIRETCQYYDKEI